MISARTATLTLVLAAAAGCGTKDARLFAPAFRDHAPANATAREMPTVFTDRGGNPVDVADYRGKAHVVLVVLRGMPRAYDGLPCPYCVAQTDSLAANYPEFRRRGAEVVVVFPGTAEQVREFVRYADGGPGLPFPVLLDADLAACDRLGIRGDLAKPSTYILDREGDVVYAYVGRTYVDRPSVKAQLEQLDRLSASPPAGPPHPGRE